MTTPGPTATPDPQAFSAALITWHGVHGRHDLPWQTDRGAYRVWVSEIMLQQTQVATVIPYYGRFMQRFPQLADLAGAPIDEVLHLWSGLGYYSRARNLHRAAQMVVRDYAGEFPSDPELLEQLPGIGRSTAAAIAALAFDRSATICDGNVKRVLARYFAVEGPLGERAVEAALWRHAQACTPPTQLATYTQAIMDFGATLCTRSRPLCMHCPVQQQCAAFATGRVLQLPVPRRRLKRPTREVVMLLAVDPHGQVLLHRRPNAGIWGGLWSPPEFVDAAAAKQYCEETLSSSAAKPYAMTPLRHAFTHFDLTITPLRVACPEIAPTPPQDTALWYNAREPARVGLPAPIATLLSQMELP
jgi:A/G-specific adenine glycosylase